ncbi:acyltransferase family protein [Intestinibacter bartlettii]|uniref:Acyltransferase n=1 Tax=Intestinibacter bartlettii TaxID=261299 RepID=A0ABS6DZZ3_9FIRM|nr:acyltransferase [Intestinibacter bartlettii]MBU5337310.1 acyltransferase [Intestinibacter bartlettii]
MKKTIVGIDLFKLIAAILVVILHCTGNYFGEAGRLFVRNICSIAVPFFFITSGYFFGIGMQRYKNNQKKYFVEYEKKLIKMYTVWSIIGIPFMVKLYYGLYGNRPMYIFLLMIRNVFFTGTFGVYWYILSMIGASFLMYFFIKKDKVKIMYIMSSILFLFGVLYVGFQNSLGKNIIFYYMFRLTWIIFACERNFLMVGWFYMCIGYYFATHEINIKLSKSIKLFVFFTILKFSESFLNSLTLLDGNEICIFHSLQAIAFFLIALNLKLDCIKKYSKIMRELSSTIYFTHFLFIDILNPTQIGNTLITFIEVMILCLTFYVVVKKINNKKLNVFINA